MTDGPVRVMPREPLVAHRAVPIGDEGDVWVVNIFEQMDDDEFPAHFVPADAYERLIAAVAVEIEYHAHIDAYGDRTDKPCNCSLCAAYRAFVGGDR